jgi:hypothetical protein
MMLINDFHNRQTRVRTDLSMTKRRALDIKRRLCIPGECSCSDSLGVRNRGLENDEDYRALLRRAEEASHG